MGSIFQRAHARWPCNIEVQLFQGQAAERPIGRGLMIDISLSGAFLRCVDELKVGSQYRLSFVGVTGALEIPFRVARVDPQADPEKKEVRYYGLTFVVDEAAEQRLRLLIDKVRRTDTLEEDKRDRSARGYWSS